MSAFRTALAATRTSHAGRRFVFVPYDQLGDHVGPLAREDPREVGIVLVECPEKAARRPYHKQKLALVLAEARRSPEQKRAAAAVFAKVSAALERGDELTP